MGGKSLVYMAELGYNARCICRSDSMELSHGPHQPVTFNR
jgi:hypothetical protein